MSESVDETRAKTAALTYCSETARAADATLIGTAEQVDVWILLEYAAPWRPKAVNDNALPPAVNAWLDTAVTRIEAELHLNARVQFIRQPSRVGLEPVLFIVICGEAQRSVRQFTLNGYDVVPGIDPVAAVRGEPTSGTHIESDSGTLVDAPLYLVCTHGQRDICCARFGTPVYEGLAAVHGSAVWQTTHIGGHRYAPNLVCLPEGLVYGFVDPDAAAEIVAATARGGINLAHLRGRSCFPSHVQVAEGEARRRTSVMHIDGLRLSGERALGEAIWRVTFAIAGHGRLALTVRAAAPREVQASCGDGQRKWIDQYELVDDAASV